MHKLIDNRYTLVAVLALFAVGSAPAVDAKVKITHKAEKEVPSGERIALSVGIKDKKHAIELVRTYFKAKEGSKFYFVAMRPANGNTYAGMLPAPAFGAESVEYFFLVKTDSVVKSQNFIVEVEDDDEALARLQEQPPRDIQAELEEIEQLTGKLRSTEPSEASRVQVWSPSSSIPAGIKGFDDYISLARVSAGAVLGAASTTSTVAASSGIGAAGIAGIALGAAAVGGGGGSSSSSGSGGGGASSDISGSWSGTWFTTAPIGCAGEIGTWDATFTVTDGRLSGSVSDSDGTNASVSGSFDETKAIWTVEITGDGLSASGVISGIAGTSISGTWVDSLDDCPGPSSGTFSGSKN